MLEILTSAQLIEQTRVKLGNSFPRSTFDIVIAEPPAILLESQRVMHGEGFGNMKPIYFPLGETRPDSPLPDGWVKMQQWVFDQIKIYTNSIECS